MPEHFSVKSSLMCVICFVCMSVTTAQNISIRKHTEEPVVPSLANVETTASISANLYTFPAKLATCKARFTHLNRLLPSVVVKSVAHCKYAYSRSESLEECSRTQVIDASA